MSITLATLLRINDCDVTTYCAIYYAILLDVKIQLRLGLRFSINTFSFCRLVIMLSLCILKIGKTLNFGSVVAQLSIWALILSFRIVGSRMCCRCMVIRFRRSFVSPIYSPLHPLQIITYITFLTSQVMFSFTVIFLPHFNVINSPSIKWQHRPQFARLHLVTFGVASISENLAFVSSRFRLGACRLLLIMVYLSRTVFICLSLFKMLKSWCISENISGFLGLNVLTYAIASLVSLLVCWVCWLIRLFDPVHR